MAYLEKIVNSTASTAVSRLMITLFLPVLLGALGWLIIDKLDSITTTQGRMWERFGKTSEVITEIKTNLAVSAANLAAHSVEEDRFVRDTKDVLSDHEQRIRLLQANRTFAPSPLSPLTPYPIPVPQHN